MRGFSRPPNDYSRYGIERRSSGFSVPHEIARRGQLRVTAFSSNNGLLRLSPSYSPTHWNVGAIKNYLHPDVVNQADEAPMSRSTPPDKNEYR